MVIISDESDGVDNLQVSACCGIDWICVSSLYCTSSFTGSKNVGACTDRSFKDNACPFKNLGRSLFSEHVILF